MGREARECEPLGFEIGLQGQSVVVGKENSLRILDFENLN